MNKYIPQSGFEHRAVNMPLNVVVFAFLLTLESGLSLPAAQQVNNAGERTTDLCDAFEFREYADIQVISRFILCLLRALRTITNIIRNG